MSAASPHDAVPFIDWSCLDKAHPRTDENDALVRNNSLDSNSGNNCPHGLQFADGRELARTFSITAQDCCRRGLSLPSTSIEIASHGHPELSEVPPPPLSTDVEQFPATLLSRANSLTNNPSMSAVALFDRLPSSPIGLTSS